MDIHTTDLYRLYYDPTGTSMAAPHVTGGLALLLNAFPDLSADEQEAALINSSLDLGSPGPDNDFGYGRLDLMAAYQWLQAGGGDPTPTPTPDPNINLALNKPVTVSSAQDDTHSGAMAVDGNLATMWQTATAKGKNKLPSKWITVDLGSSMAVGRAVLEWDVNYATGYTLQVSDDNANWTTVYSTTNGNGATDTIDFSLTPAQYIKLNTTNWTSGRLCN